MSGTRRANPADHGATTDDVLKPVGLVGRFLYWFLRGVGVGLAKVLWRLQVVGSDRVPSVGPFILCPVHRSNADFLVAGMAVRRRMRFMAKHSLFRDPRFARFIESAGAFPVDRDKPDRTALRRAEAAVQRGEPVVMFPEGRRKDGPVVTELHGGPAWVACRQRIPVVPVGIGGTDRALPIGARMIRLVKVRVVIGEPIYPEVPLTGKVSRSSVNQLTERLREELQDLYDDLR